MKCPFVTSAWSGCPHQWCWSRQAAVTSSRMSKILCCVPYSGLVCGILSSQCSNFIGWVMRNSDCPCDRLPIACKWRQPMSPWRPSEACSTSYQTASPSSSIHACHVMGSIATILLRNKRTTGGTGNQQARSGGRYLRIHQFSQRLTLKHRRKQTDRIICQQKPILRWSHSVLRSTGRKCRWECLSATI